MSEVPNSEDGQAWPTDAVEVGVVMGAWGVKGGLKLKPHAAVPEALFSTKRWWVRGPEGLPLPAAQALQDLGQPWKVAQAREQGDAVVATVQGLADRDLAQALRGCTVHVPRSSFPTAGEGEYYWVDLIGLSVVNLQGEALGTVVGLLSTGPHSVLRIEPPPGADEPAPERLVPFVAAYVHEVSLPQRRITVDWGLDY